MKRNVYFKLQRELQNFYKELKDSILSITTDIEVKMKKHNIGFVRKDNFVEVTFSKSSLKLYLNIKNNQLNDQRQIARNGSKVGYPGTWNYEFILKDFDNI